MSLWENRFRSAKKIQRSFYFHQTWFTLLTGRDFFFTLHYIVFLTAFSRKAGLVLTFFLIFPASSRCPKLRIELRFQDRGDESIFFCLDNPYFPVSGKHLHRHHTYSIDILGGKTANTVVLFRLNIWDHLQILGSSLLAKKFST